MSPTQTRFDIEFKKLNEKLERKNNEYNRKMQNEILRLENEKLEHKKNEYNQKLHNEILRFESGKFEKRNDEYMKLKFL